MTMSVKMLAEIAAHAQAMADEAQAMATAMQAVVNDCADQMAAKQDADATNGASSARGATRAKATNATSAKTTDATNAKATNTTDATSTKSAEDATSAKSTDATSAKTTDAKDATDTSAPGNTDTTPPWVAEVEANIQPPKPEPGKKLTIAEVRAYVAERSKPENRAKIRAILKRFGVAKLTELPEDKYEVMMEEVAKL